MPQVVVPPVRTVVMRQEDHGSPVQPQIGTVTMLRHDGSSRIYQVHPFLHEPGDWSTPYGSVRDAVLAVDEHNRDFHSIAFGVVKAQDGAFQLRPLETETGNAFVIDGPAYHNAGITASATSQDFLAMVGRDQWIDFTQPGKTKDQKPQPIERPAAARR